MDAGVCVFLNLDTNQLWTSRFLYFVHSYLFALNLLRSGDIEENPGPVGLDGICRGCGSENIEEKDCLRVKYFVENHMRALEMAFHHPCLVMGLSYPAAFFLVFLFTW